MTRRCTAALGLSAAILIAGCGQSPRTSASASASAWSSRDYRVADADADAAGGRAELGVATNGSVLAEWLASPSSSKLRTGVGRVAADGKMVATGTVAGAPIGAPIGSSVATSGAVATLGVSRPGSQTADGGLWVNELGRGGAGETTPIAAKSIGTGNAALASSSDGAAVLAWFEGIRDGADTATLKVAQRSADGVWSPPVTLQQGAALLTQSSPNVAVATRTGDDPLIVSQSLVSDQQGLVAWRLRDGRVSSPITVAPRRYASVLRAVITSTGTGIVAWSEESVGSDVDTAMSVRSVALPPGKTTAVDAATIDRGGASDRPRPGFELVASPNGATLAWSQIDARGDQISIATADDRGRFASRRQVIRGVAELGGLAIRADGTALLTAGHPDDRGLPDRVMAWIRRPNASEFSELDAVPVPRRALAALFDTSGSVDQGTVDQDPLRRVVPGPAFDPSTGDALVATATAGGPGRDALQLTILRRSLP